MPSAFIADEIGAFKDAENINAMKSGQLSIKNPIALKLTTAYPEDQSIMLEELAYIKKVFDGHIEDDRMFALIILRRGRALLGRYRIVTGESTPNRRELPRNQR